MSVTFLGTPVSVHGQLPKKGEKAPQFTLCDQTMTDIHIEDFDGKKMVLNIFPSTDTPTCATSIRSFNEAAKKLDNTVVLCVSADLPFALARFVERYKLEHVSIASCFRSSDFAKSYGVAITDGLLRGLTSRAVIVLDEHRHVLYSQLVSEIAEEPNYEQAIASINGEKE
ncbi:thiol peroxidase [Vibrio mediterranei]|uniref:thiol peroxidase n=1 Tax=Vibrio mediterranei TaxID=689 RepID=UPI001EFD3D0A|nr:thiol peroxidase [Vibrio mediterranei]MCG9628674.1 thiol peroxidase [Vibrio mediterranei]